MKVTKAVIPAAGLGTRFLPFTKAVPKEMLPVVDTPAIEIIIQELVDSGIREIMIITNEGKDAIKNHFSPAKSLEAVLLRDGKKDLHTLAVRSNTLANISYAYQNTPKGLADAVYHAKDFVGNEPFALLLGDDVVYNPRKPATRQLIEVFEQTQKCVLGVQQVAKSELKKYGILQLGAKFTGIPFVYNVEGVTEKPKTNPPSDLAILGRYIFTADIFEAIERTKPRTEAGEVYLTDSFEYIARQQGLLGYEFEGIRYDLGDKLGYLKATVEYGLRHEGIGGDFRKYLDELMKK